MKVLLLCILLAYVKARSVPVDLKSLLARATEHCITELNLNREKYEKVLFKNEKFPEDDEEFGKFYSCVGNERNYFLENGELNLPLIHVQLEELIRTKFGHGVNSKEIAHEIKESCFATSKADKPNNAIQAHNCGIGIAEKHTIEHIESELKSAITHCTEKLNLNKEKYAKVMLAGEKYPEDDDEFAKLYGCVGDERKHFLESGELNLPLIHKQIEQLIAIKFPQQVNSGEIAKEVKENCFATSKADKPNNAVRAHNCAVGHIEKHTTEHIESELKSAITHCAEKLNLSKEKYEKVILADEKYPEDDDEFAKLYGCVGDERKHFLESGEMNLPLIHKQIEQLIVIKFPQQVNSGEIAKEVKENCFATSKADKPHNAIRGHNCAVGHIEKHTTEHIESELKSAITHCAEKLNLSKEKYEKVILADEKYPEDDDEFAKLYGCVGDERKHFLESGEMNLPLIHKQIEQLIVIKFPQQVNSGEIAKEVKENCFATSKADKPNNAIRGHNCAVGHIEKHTTEHIESELKSAITHCTEKLNLNKEKYEKVILAGEKYPEDDDEFAKLYECVGDERKFFLESGELNLPLIHKQIEQLIAIKFPQQVNSGEIAKEVKENCFATSKADKPNNAVRGHNCAVGHVEKHTIEHIESDRKRTTTHCIEKLNLNKEKYEKVMLANQKFPEDDDEFAKFYGCVGDERKYFLKSGELNLPLIHKKIEQSFAIKFQKQVNSGEIANEVKENCFATSKADKPYNAIRAHNCEVGLIEKYLKS